MPVAAQKQQQQMTRISLPRKVLLINAEAEQPAPAKEQKATGPLDWDMMHPGKGMRLHHWNSSLELNLHVCGWLGWGCGLAVSSAVSARAKECAVAGAKKRR
jgi:hypothetical protein